MRFSAVARTNPTQTEQYTIPFETDNRFADRLRSGRFAVTVECDSPAGDQPFEPAVALLRNLAKHAAKCEEVTALALTDRLADEERYDPPRIAGIMAEASGKPVVMHLSGKGAAADRIHEQLSQAAAEGVRNVLAITGDGSEKHPAAHALNRNPPHPVGYFDSVQTLHAAHERHPALHLGAGVNPFKYNPADQYLQYFKVMRKLAAGADFVVTNFGWDMAKLQELQWYLQMREVEVPVLARAGILAPEVIRKLGDNVVPGVPVSRTFAALLQRESNINETQSMAAQLQRLGLQVTGCRLLGYSGVQLTGIRDPKTLDMVLRRIAETGEELQSYNDWLAAWRDYHKELVFAPSADAYYGFENLMTPDLQMYSATESRLSEHPFPQSRAKDRFRSVSLRILLGKRMPEPLKNIVRRVLCRNCGTQGCRLEAAFYLCPRACPKRLVQGACGGSQVDGTCEFGQHTCFFHRVLAQAVRRHDFDKLEAPVQND